MSLNPILHFSERFNGIIWSMLILPERNLLFLEVREGEQLRVSFSAYNFVERSFLWKDWLPVEQWWLSLLAVRGNMLLLNSFKGSGNPDHKTLICCDVDQKVVRWQVPEFSFHHWQPGVIVGYDTNGGIEQAVINDRTGEVSIRSWSFPENEEPSASILPVQFMEGSEHFGSIQKFIDLRADRKVIKSVEYLDWEHFLIMSYYTQTKSGLANFLIVTDRDGKILVEDCLGDGLSGLGRDSFFIVSGCLFYVKNRSELVAYKLYG